MCVVGSLGGWMVFFVNAVCYFLRSLRLVSVIARARVIIVVTYWGVGFVFLGGVVVYPPMGT